MKFQAFPFICLCIFYKCKIWWQDGGAKGWQKRESNNRKREREREREETTKRRLFNQITGWLTYICNLYVIVTLIGVAFLIKWGINVSRSKKIEIHLWSESLKIKFEHILRATSSQSLGGFVLKFSIVKVYGWWSEINHGNGHLAKSGVDQAMDGDTIQMTFWVGTTNIALLNQKKFRFTYILLFAQHIILTSYMKTLDLLLERAILIAMHLMTK